MDTSLISQMKAIKKENRRLKRMYADPNRRSRFLAQTHIISTPLTPPRRSNCTTRSTDPSQYRFTSSNPIPSPAAITMIANLSMAFRAVSA